VSPGDRAKLLLAFADMGDALADKTMREASKRPMWWEEPDIALGRQEGLKDQAIVFHKHATACRNQADTIMKRAIIG